MCRASFLAGSIFDHYLIPVFYQYNDPVSHYPAKNNAKQALCCYAYSINLQFYYFARSANSVIMSEINLLISVKVARFSGNDKV
jgi:hypothetical protein